MNVNMLNSLRTIVQRVSQCSDLGTALKTIVDQVQKAMSASVCSVYLWDAEGERYVLLATRGLKLGAVRKVSLGVGEGLVGLVAERDEPLNLESAQTHPRYQYFPETGEERYSSFLGVPIIHHGRVLGVLVVQQKARRRFDQDEEAFLITLSAQLAAVIAHAESTGDLERLTRRDRRGRREVRFSGIAGAPGIAIGTAVICSSSADLYSVGAQQAEDTKAEVAKFQIAIEKASLDIKALEKNISQHVTEQERLLFSAYVQMLCDPQLEKEVIDRINTNVSAQSAWSEVIIGHCGRFEAMEDSYLRERAADLRDLGKRVLEYLQDDAQETIDYPDQTILVGEELTASMLGAVPRKKLVGMVSVKGAVNSHLAILARAMDIPTVVGVEGLRFDRLRNKEIILDGNKGSVFLNASYERVRYFREVMREDRELLREMEAIRDEPCETLDGHRLKLLVNTGLMADVKLSLERRAEGVGLYRSEVPFFIRERFPTEEEQRAFYREHLLAFSPRPVVMRTLDIGGDKALPYFPIDEANPFLGWRGIRITIDHPEIFLGQVRALLKASRGLDNLRILLPMISSQSELTTCLALIRRAFRELTEEEGFSLEMPRLGVMIEVPSAVYLARQFAAQVDFLSVGSNDLTQYMLAVDRNNARVAKNYQTLHPAVLQAIKHTVDCAHAEGKPASICGEFAGDPFGALLATGMGYDSLSMNASSLLRVKALLRSVRKSELDELVRKVLQLEDASEVYAHIDRFIVDPNIRRLLSMSRGS